MQRWLGRSHPDGVSRVKNARARQRKPSTCDKLSGGARAGISRSCGARSRPCSLSVEAGRAGGARPCRAGPNSAGRQSTLVRLRPARRKAGAMAFGAREPVQPPGGGRAGFWLDLWSAGQSSAHDSAGLGHVAAFACPMMFVSTMEQAPRSTHQHVPARLRMLCTEGLAVCRITLGLDVGCPGSV